MAFLLLHNYTDFISLYRNIFYIILIISLIVKIIYDYVKKSKTTKKFN